MEKILDFDKGNEASKYYRFQCDCLTPADAMDISVDAWGKDGDKKAFTISMYFNGTGFINRVKYAWQILRGHWAWREFILRDEDTKPLSDILNPNNSFNDLP